MSDYYIAMDLQNKNKISIIALWENRLLDPSSSIIVVRIYCQGHWIDMLSKNDKINLFFPP